MGLWAVPGREEEEEVVLLLPWSAGPEPESTASSPGMRGWDEWRRPAAVAQSVSSATIWEVALTAKKSDGFGKHLGPLSPVGSQQREADVWGWRTGGFSINRREGPSIPLHGNSPLSISGSSPGGVLIHLVKI